MCRGGGAVLASRAACKFVVVLINSGIVNELILDADCPRGLSATYVINRNGLLAIVNTTVELCLVNTVEQYNIYEREAA